MSKNVWNIDTSHSSVTFAVRHMVISKTRGRFANWSGEIELDESDLSSSRVSVTIDAASIDTADPKRDAHLRSADFLDVEAYPELTFESTQVIDLGGGKLRVIGDLTLHGVTREVELSANLLGRGTDPWGGERIGFEAHTRINRKDFGLTWNQVLDTGGVLVGDKIDLSLEIEAVLAAVKTAAA